MTGQHNGDGRKVTNAAGPRSQPGGISKKMQPEKVGKNHDQK